ncbi:hypothetical protein HMPREF9074_07203, partial [Capnocytophaga sp. oral taxon 329 str. F0087]
CLQQTKIKNKPLLKSYFYYLNLGCSYIASIGKVAVVDFSSKLANLLIDKLFVYLYPKF